jgi:hypothetical protein
MGIMKHTSRAEAAADTNLQAAVENVEKVADLMAGKSAEEASALASSLLETAMAMGGTELELRERIAKVVAACIATSGANASAVAGALVKAGGSAYTGVVVAAVAVAAQAAGLTAEVVEAAVGAAADADKEVARGAAADPQQYLGRMGVWLVENTARRFVTGGVQTGTTTTTSTTTTLPSATPAAAGM